MIFFILSNKTKDIVFDEPKKIYCIENSDTLSEFFKNNSDNLNRFNLIVIDEALLTEELLNDFKSKFKNKVIVLSSTNVSTIKYKYCISKDTPLKKQIDDIQKKIETGLDTENTSIDENDDIKQDTDNDIDKIEIADTAENDAKSEDIQSNNQDNIKNFENDKINKTEKESDKNQKEESSLLSEKDKLLEEFNNLDKLNLKTATQKDNEKTDDEKTNSIPVNKKQAEDKTSSDLFSEKRRRILEKTKKKIESEKAENNNEQTKQQATFTDIFNIEKVTHNVDEVQQKNEKVKEAVDNYKDTSHISDEEVDKLMNKSYDISAQTDDIYILNRDTKEDEKDKAIVSKPKIQLPKMPSFNKKKKKKKEKQAEPKINISISNSKGEIAIAGGLDGVGTTYCAFKLASLYPNNLQIGYIQYEENEIEISILKEVQEQGYINDNITIYSSYEMLSAYQENDIVIIDYGQFDISNSQLLIEFERASNKYIVVNSKFNKITSINKAITYSQQSNNFKTIFNMQDESELIKLQKKYRDLDIICFGYDSL
ncbi:hypothetical protein [Peptoanaerobacter stomatis]